MWVVGVHKLEESDIAPDPWFTMHMRRAWDRLKGEVEKSTLGIYLER